MNINTMIFGSVLIFGAALPVSPAFAEPVEPGPAPVPVSTSQDGSTTPSMPLLDNGPVPNLPERPTSGFVMPTEEVPTSDPIEGLGSGTDASQTCSTTATSSGGSETVCLPTLQYMHETLGPVSLSSGAIRFPGPLPEMRELLR